MIAGIVEGPIPEGNIAGGKELMTVADPGGGTCPPPPLKKCIQDRDTLIEQSITNHSNKAVTVFMGKCSLLRKL